MAPLGPGLPVGRPFIAPAPKSTGEARIIANRIFTMDQGSLSLTLDDVSALFERPVSSEEHCRRFALPLIDKMGASLCTVVLGPRRSPHMVYACDPAGPIPSRQVLGAGSAALDPVYCGDAVLLSQSDPWPEGLPFGPDDLDLPTHGNALLLPLHDGHHGVAGFATLHGIPRPIDPGQLRKLRALARVFSLSLANAQLGSAAEQLSEASSEDALTGTLNRSAFYDRLRAEWRRSARELTSLAIALLDIDFFMRYNDTYGEPSGDRAMRAVAETIANAGLRSSDFVARYDGDVFAIGMPRANDEGALAVCDRIRSAIAERRLEHSASPFRILTASIGVASMRPNSRRVPAALLYEADAALHRAKHAGRNRVAAKEDIRTSTPAAPRSALPEPPYQFVGRDRELDELKACGAPLMTILGAKGSGKTALALEFARRADERAVFVELQRTQACDAIPQIASALEIAAHSAAELARALRDGTRHEPLLVVLDGCDDVLDDAIQFVKAVRGLQGVRTIVTSRSPLRLRGERIFDIAEKT